MKQIYWVEDELNVFTWALEKFKRASVSVKEFRTASALVESLGAIKGCFGPVIIDLYVPPGGSTKLPQNLNGPQMGMWMLGRIQAELGKQWPIFILSGNLTVDITTALGRDYDIPDSRIYAKPLLPKADEFVSKVIAATNQEWNIVE